MTFPVPESVRAVVYDRQYVPRTIHLLAKPVVATGGDHVCIRRRELVVNGQVAGKVLERDQEGRPMPQYSGCGGLQTDEVFVATDHEHSFDSRYFGPIPLMGVRGTLTPLLIVD